MRNELLSRTYWIARPHFTSQSLCPSQVTSRTASRRIAASCSGASPEAHPVSNKTNRAADLRMTIPRVLPAGAGCLITREHREGASCLFPEGILLSRPPDRANLCSRAKSALAEVIKPFASVPILSFARAYAKPSSPQNGRLNSLSLASPA